MGAAMITSRADYSFLLTWEWWKPFVGGAALGTLMISPFIFMLPSISNKLSAGEYRWLGSQVTVYPEFREDVSDALSDDGEITRWELRLLKRWIEAVKRQEAKTALARQLAQ